MTDWDTEDEYVAAAKASLPTPSDTPYRTPSRGSRRSSHRRSISPSRSSPPPLPYDQRGSADFANDERISILDPRRFTPTLHANLVAEILNLRRDQEEKAKAIESLETALHKSQIDHESSGADVLAAAKENRSLKRQLALLEGGTSSALSELARERDEAVESNTEIKKRWEGAQKRIRTQEDDSNRTHELWLKEKDQWEDEKRKYERKIHIAEGRLKTVLDEFTAYQAGQQQNDRQNQDNDELQRELNDHGSDAASIRTMSMTNSIRFSMLSGPNGYGMSKVNGISLADELDLDDEDDTTDHDGRESAMSLTRRHMRNQSRDSLIGRGHRRTQSIESLIRPTSVARGRMATSQAMMDRLGDGILEDDETPVTKVEYIDTGIQYSDYSPIPAQESADDISPSSHQILAEIATPGKLQTESGAEEPMRAADVEANQRKKRMQAIPLPRIEPPKEDLMVSTSVQTVDLPSPPRTPVSPTLSLPPVADRTREMSSSSTQTDPPSLALPSPIRAPPPPPIDVPSIQLHPPSSAPTTPREPLLPQHSKDVGCQVSMQVSIPTRSVSMQTEEIRVDQRLNLLPLHLQPSSISSAPPSPEPNAAEQKSFTPVPGNIPPRNPLRSRYNRDSDPPSSPPLNIETRDAYPGNNDDGPLSKDDRHENMIRRPYRISSLFAGFENASSDEAEDFEADMSDSDYRTPLSAPKHSRLSQPTSPVPEGIEPSEPTEYFPAMDTVTEGIPTSPVSRKNTDQPQIKDLASRNSVKSAVRQQETPLTLITSVKPSTMRRTALIQSGVAAHSGRPRSPSLSDPVKEPPFPIPTRASSRKPGNSSSAPSDTASPPHARVSRDGSYRTNSVRKVRSAAALPRNSRSHRRRSSRSPPPMSVSTEAPESPRLPPMPTNEITSPRFMRDTASSKYRTHRHQTSNTTAHTANTANTANTGYTAYTANTSNTAASVGSGAQATSVVDAIAQTMVGEWMFKYVRRRTSFGVPEGGGGDETTNGVRHRRWVWLAPYERAVMWSSKQPTSGPALLGKTGRKLTIQSVLDVKDDNPTPKGFPPVFNRSILILTPARALKFTATSLERHYVWLTALSFLAHSSQAVPDIISPPPAAPAPRPALPEFEPPAKNTRVGRRGGIRDSIRVAKGKTVTARSGPTSVASFQSAPTDYPPIPASPDTAQPPVVPRFSDRTQYAAPASAPNHGRKRSYTGGHIPPPLSFRGFSGPSMPSHAPTSSITGHSVGTTGSSDIYQSNPASSVTGYTAMSASGLSSVRTSDVSARPSVAMNNFFDAVGTMRMEAFISPLAHPRFDGGTTTPPFRRESNLNGIQRRRSKETRRRGSHRNSRGMGSDDWYGGSRTAGEEEYGSERISVGTGNGYDPFRGF